MLLVAFKLLGLAALVGADKIRLHSAQGVNLWKLSHSSSPFFVQNSDIDTQSLNEFPAQWFKQPIDHEGKVDGTWKQRYWVNTRHYVPGMGGPVIVLDGGETSGVDRIPFLDTGIVEILARATGGVGIVLEHRYYGESLVTQNLTTDSLRFLTNEQSAADSANFISHVNLSSSGISEDLTAPGTPWIYYGGSYAGARAAHMRMLYPDLVFGAIASSGVTHASIIFWEYFDAIKEAAEPKCADAIVGSIKTVDKLLAGRLTRGMTKRLFGLDGIEHDDDFASVLEAPLGYWQAQCWVPEFGSTVFQDFCAVLTKSPIGFEAEFGDEARMVETEEGLTVDFAVLNYAKWIKENVVPSCPSDLTQEQCFGTYDDAQYANAGIDQHWRLWLFQVCTQWGYFMTHPPQDIPSLISKHITLSHESKICHQAFPPGEHFTVPDLPDVMSVNKLGGFDIASDRLAIIDGSDDPWRPATPHSEYALEREDTLERPFKVIREGVHHYDEWGLRDMSAEPEEIRKIHGEMIVFVMEWLKEWTPKTRDELK